MQLLRQFSVIVDHKYVSTRLKVENDRSGVADVTGIVMYRGKSLLTSESRFLFACAVIASQIVRILVTSFTPGRVL